MSHVISGQRSLPVMVRSVGAKGVCGGGRSDNCDTNDSYEWTG